MLEFERKSVTMRFLADYSYFGIDMICQKYYQWGVGHKGKDMKRNRICVLGIISTTLLLGACTAASHRQAVQDDSADKLTVGTVQREIVMGMPSSEVIAILGSPNIVTTDEKRLEVWVWDKLSTNVAYSRSSGAIAGLIVGGSGGGIGGASASSGAASTSQRTLTVIIKFDDQSRVRDVAYRQSSF